MEIIIDYDGKYPNLCSGKLVVAIDGVIWDFPEDCMISGGSFESAGPWKIKDWPKDFPENLKSSVLDGINEIVEWGCCGGCI